MCPLLEDILATPDEITAEQGVDTRGDLPVRSATNVLMKVENQIKVDI